jgi:CheY-like chemotaxis protein
MAMENYPIRSGFCFVEDEFLISEWIAQSLSDQGFAVNKVSNATDALRKIACGSVDILLTDIDLPGGMDGTELARRVRVVEPALPVIYASAHVKFLRQEDCVPGSFVVAKPYDPAVVGRLLSTAVRSARRDAPPVAALEPA